MFVRNRAKRAIPVVASSNRNQMRLRAPNRSNAITALEAGLLSGKL